MRRMGFTVLELLVVIAIIALLATVTLVSLNNSRVKARNAWRIAQLEQVVRALTFESHRINNDLSGEPSQICIGSYKAEGDFASGECGGSTSVTLNTSAALEVLLSEYFPSPPLGDHYQFKRGNAFMRGFVMQHDATPTTYTIYYRLEGLNQDCGLPGAVGLNRVPPTFNEMTSCIYTGIK